MLTEPSMGALQLKTSDEKENKRNGLILRISTKKIEKEDRGKGKNKKK